MRPTQRGRYASWSGVRVAPGQGSRWRPLPLLPVSARQWRSRRPLEGAGPGAGPVPTRACVVLPATTGGSRSSLPCRASAKCLPNWLPTVAIRQRFRHCQPRFSWSRPWMDADESMRCRDDHRDGVFAGQRHDRWNYGPNRSAPSATREPNSAGHSPRSGRRTHVPGGASYRASAGFLPGEKPCFWARLWPGELG